MKSRRDTHQTRQEVWGMDHAQSIVESGILGSTVVEDKLDGILGKSKIYMSKFIHQ
jgi:hypothetical protein